MEIIKYYHKNSDVRAYEKEVYSDVYWIEKTYDEQGNELTYKNSWGYYEIKGKEVTKEEFENFINRPHVGEKIIINGFEYELK